MSGSTTLYMIRHADSPYSFGTERTRELSGSGRLAALKACETMRGEEVDVVVSSPYARAVQTVRGIAEERGLVIRLYEELRERLIQGHDSRIANEERIEAIKRSFTDFSFALPGGESTEAAQRRAVPVIRGLLADNQGRKIAVGTHGNLMAAVMNSYDGRYGFEFWRSLTMPDIYRLDFDGQHLVRVERLWRE